MPEQALDYSARRGPSDRRLRVGDRERDAVAEQLRDHHVAGRLDNDELQERVELALTAKTHEDLDRVIADLPSERQARARPPFRPVAVLVPLVVTVLAVTAALGHPFWPAIPAFFFGTRRILARRSGWGRWDAGPRALAQPDARP